MGYQLAVIVLIVAMIVFGTLVEAVPSGFTVQRNVMDFGAVGDGVADDTEAFIAALTNGKATIARSGTSWASSQYGPQTTLPSIVYVPNGTYRMTATLPIPYYTQLVGAHFPRPTLRFETSISSGSYRALDAGTDEGPGNGWYGGANQNNFYRQIRNVVVDARDCEGCTGVHWMVSQGTVIRNVDLLNSPAGTGIFMESGSGGFLGDLVVDGGKYGLNIGNQQFTFRNVTVKNADLGINILWNWVMSFFDVHFVNTSTAVYAGASAGSLGFVDCTFTNVTGTALQIFGHSTTFYVENAMMQDVNVSLQTLFETVTEPVKDYLQGVTAPSGTASAGSFTPQPRPASLLDAAGRYVGAPRPNVSTADLITLDLANGTDVTTALQRGLNAAATAGKAVFLPYGTYLITDTVVVPTGTRLFGEVWTRLAATGSRFADPADPVAVLQLGVEGDIGTIQLADLLLTNVGPVPGAVMVRWNTRASPAAPASCGAWDVHFRVGGADGTDMNSVQCPTNANFTNASSSGCHGAHTLLHLAPSSGNVYLENMWGWVADHDIDTGLQTNVFNARGFLSEARHGGVWLYGTAFEHSYLYQYRVAPSATADHFIGIAQTETPYYQPQFAITNTTAGIVLISSDPSFATEAAPHQEHAYAIAVDPKSQGDLRIVGVGSYSFFHSWKPCGSTVEQPCQPMLVQLGVGFPQYQAVLVNTHGARDVLDLFSAAPKRDITQCWSGTFANGFCQTANYVSGSEEKPPKRV